MSFDSDQICVFNPCGDNVNAKCLSLETVYIDPSDSPFTPSGDVVIFANAEDGEDIDINLVNPDDCDHPTFYIKLDAGEGVVRIHPPAGELIDGGAGPYILSDVGSVVQVIRAGEIIPDWEILTNVVPPVLTTKGDVLSHNGTETERLPTGTLGQLLSVDPSEPTGLKWITSTAAQNIVVYHIVSTTIDVIMPGWTTVGNFAWDQSRYSGYSNGVLVYYAHIDSGKLPNIRLMKDGIMIGNAVGIPATGIYNMTVSPLPITDGLIELQVQFTDGDGDFPQLISAQLEFRA